MNRDVYASSKSVEWETPQDFFDKLDAEFHFTVDVCANVGNAKVKNYISKEQNSLNTPWNGVCWMNPPYGREIKTWMCKAYNSAFTRGSTVVCLVPARTDTSWWHLYAMKGEVRFIRGRLKFGGSKWNAPFPNAVVIFRPRKPTS